jgi:hypothetical protein
MRLAAGFVTAFFWDRGRGEEMGVLPEHINTIYKQVYINMNKHNIKDIMFRYI